MTLIRPARLASYSLLMLSLIVLTLGFALLGLAGCAAKPGTALNVAESGETGGPVTMLDPTGTHSTAVLGSTINTASGPFVSEASKLDDEGIWENNSGGAAKQRVSIVVLPDGTVRAGGSAASDLDIGEIESTWTPGADGSMARRLVFRNLKTNNSAVQRALNEGVGLLVTQWQRASDNERAVLEAQLAAQAKIGDAVAATAQAVIEVLKKTSIP